MKSIREIFKIGKGPSSSHTIGPERAARLYKNEHPDADGYRVTLYESLSKTGKGHGTDRVLREVFSPKPTEIIFSEESPADLPHPNTMDFEALRGGQATDRLRVMSIGGGDIRVEGWPWLESQEVYPENTYAEVEQFLRFRGLSLAEYVAFNEGEEIWPFLGTIWDTMKNAIEEGIRNEGELPGGLHILRKAKLLYTRSTENELPQVRECRILSAYAFAVSEQNADCGTIVTAPTCGACGILPAVLRLPRKPTITLMKKSGAAWPSPGFSAISSRKTPPSPERNAGARRKSAPRAPWPLRRWPIFTATAPIRSSTRRKSPWSTISA